VDKKDEDKDKDNSNEISKNNPDELEIMMK